MKRKFTIPLILALIAFVAAFAAWWIILVVCWHAEISDYGFRAEYHAFYAPADGWYHADTAHEMYPIHQEDLPWSVGGKVGIVVLAVALAIMFGRKFMPHVVAFARLADRQKYAIVLLLALYVYVRVSRYDSILPDGFIFGEGEKRVASKHLTFDPRRDG